MNYLQEDEMGHAKETTAQPHNDFFVVRERIAEEEARVRAENLMHSIGTIAEATAQPGRRGGVRTWLGRRLVAMGSVLTGDPPVAERHPTTGQPC
jgi:hypothetical protein